MYIPGDSQDEILSAANRVNTQEVIITGAITISCQIYT